MARHLLVVDDSSVNRLLLTQALRRQGYSVADAPGGPEAMALLLADPSAVDLVLLDVVMPTMDGYQVLQSIKAEPALRDIPVIMVSALDTLDSVVRCIELGAEDYLTKPYEPLLLQARIGACLEKKRLRDQEIEYLRNVDLLTSAASALEAANFEPDSLQGVAERGDALGRLARVFVNMAQEVRAREQRLKSQLQQLKLDIDEQRRAADETVAVYMPMDRRQALARREALPDRVLGAVLFADVSGFTPLTEALAQDLGPQRGAEEITRQLNRVYSALIDLVHGHRGSVISFGGDAITCWFDQDDGLRACTCALAMQAAMGSFSSATANLAIKVAVAAGAVRRLLVGDPRVQRLEVLAGATLEHLSDIERQAGPGEVLVQSDVVLRLGLSAQEWRGTGGTGQRCAVIRGAVPAGAWEPWPDIPPGSLREEEVRPWLPAPVYERVRQGKGEFLSELRPAAALFMRFSGIDFDGDDQAQDKLDSFVGWVQQVVSRYEGTLLQVSMGDKGSYLYAAFGAPLAHEDDAARAAAAALDLSSPPASLGFIGGIGIGVAYGQMRAGAYGSPAHRTYGVLGDRANLAARLMQAACDQILCDERINRAAIGHMRFEPLPPLAVKGKARLVPVYRLVEVLGRSVTVSRIDKLTSDEQLTLKVASVIGPIFPLPVLQAIHPGVPLGETARSVVEAHLRSLELHQLVERRAIDGVPVGVFKDLLTHEAAYDLLLFAQRRQLHRAVAEWYEQTHSTDLAPYYALLAEHWRKAEEQERASDYLEKAGARAHLAGAFYDADNYLQQSLRLEHDLGHGI